MTDKIKRFVKSLERRNDRELAIFWNEIEEDIINKDEAYINDIEWTSMGVQLHHHKFVELVANNIKWINIAKRTLKQCEAAERQFNAG